MRALFKENIIEALIGAGVLLLAIWFVTFAYDRTQRGGVSDGYTISARFPNTTGVSVGTDVRVSGLKVGTVAAEKLDTTTYQAVLRLTIDSAVKLPLDTSAAITSEGILGGNYISLAPGGDPEMLREGDEITDTQGAVDMMGLIGSVINKTGDSDETAEGAEAPAEEAEPAQ
ncbi:MAG: outer membrane lipid asymmetry maintenance protein MlaD [Sphingomonadaceae bacterium]|nr:outer membrane lipid asymmetry maintenance protein MlaD [Sphingomonadaceae bacterium]